MAQEGYRGDSPRTTGIVVAIPYSISKKTRMSTTGSQVSEHRQRIRDYRTSWTHSPTLKPLVPLRRRPAKTPKPSHAGSGAIASSGPLIRPISIHKQKSKDRSSLADPAFFDHR